MKNLNIVLLCLTSMILGGLLTYSYNESTLPELGCGYINVQLQNSVITVTDVDGDTLFTRKAHKGDWDKVWCALDDKYFENYYQ